MITQLYNDVKTMHELVAKAAKEKKEVFEKFEWTENFYSKKVESFQEELKQRSKHNMSLNDDKKALLMQINNLTSRIKAQEGESDRMSSMKDKKEDIIGDLTQ